MATKVQKKEKSGTSVWRIAGAVGTIVLLFGYILFHANFVTGRSLLLAFPGWDVTYKGCWPNPFGGAWVSDVTLVPIEGDDEETFHFDHLSIDVPLVQFYQSGFSRKRGSLLKAIKDIRLDFSGGHGDMTIPFTSEMLVFGNTSATPFEAEGCLEDGAWYSKKLPDMGLATGPTELSMAWHREDDRLVKEQSIHTPGAGRVDYRGELLLHDDYPLFSLAETGLSELAASEWHVRDEGFNAARNQFCAEKDGITPAQFVERHMATVQRMLAAMGIAPGDAVRSLYRNYVEHGAPLDLAITYSPAIGGERYEDPNFGNWLSYMHGGFVIDGRPLGVGMQPVNVRPLPEDDNAASTYALVRAELEAQAEPAVTLATPATPMAGSVEAAPTIAVVIGPKALPDAVDTVEAGVDAERAERADTISDYSRLGAEVGQRFMLYTKARPPMRVEVVGSEDGVVKVRRYLRSGWLEQGVTRASFERAERLR